MTNEQQLAVAEQIHKAVIMYNYYHRKISPQLSFADPKLFLMSLPVEEDLLTHLSMLLKRESKPGNNQRLYTCDTAALQACEIAKGLDASKDSPDMTAWPISKVAVLLIDPERKKCLIEHTQGVWSFIEFDEACSSDMIAVWKSANKRTYAAVDGANTPRELALSEVERRTGMKASNLRVLETFWAYSLSKERTATKLFLVEYEQAMKGNLVEISLEDLITSMTGPVFANHQFLKITSLVEYYHILPYKDILSELLHRKWPETLVVPTMMNSALPWQNMEVLEKSGAFSENVSDLVDESLRLIQKIRDDIVFKERILQGQSAECDMDIQRIWNEGLMTAKVLSDKYKNGFPKMEVAASSCSGDGGRLNKKTLRASLEFRKYVELDEICRDCYCISPRYTVLPSITDGTYTASVRLRCPDAKMTIYGGPRKTPLEARCSAAANMIQELCKA
ncbi:hypothetical protein CFC21_091472 [Triticum aestivum]|uniref:DRBM domain-containing protein n=4 Tax=Triticum aestivum TaxID=4565 RepID=A0A9R1LGA9_WHEAT|nr:hypothetical protein CFC21_091472 [Triticum aestivum]